VETASRRPCFKVARIVFAGSPDFAVPCLTTLAAAGQGETDQRQGGHAQSSHAQPSHEIVAVLTQPDRPSGRGRKLRPGPVKQCALERNLKVLQPDSLKGAEIQQQLRSLQADLAVIVAYGLLLPQAVLDIPRAGCINVHASLLPRWRGASPIQTAILAGDTVTGVSIMRMEAGLDTGPVFAERELAIAPDDTADTLHDRLAAQGAALLGEVVDDILDGRLEAVIQDNASATYAGRISKADAVIDWNCSTAEIDRKVRAYRSWPVAETLLDGQRMRCWAAVPETIGVEPAVAGPGAVIAADADGIVVATGDGALRLTEIQMPGRQRLPAAQFAHGYPVRGKMLGQ
jgi:methionyl-tRNA formyltransferase